MLRHVTEETLEAVLHKCDDMRCFLHGFAAGGGTFPWSLEEIDGTVRNLKQELYHTIGDESQGLSTEEQT